MQGVKADTLTHLAPNLSLYHPICHPICHLLNMLYVNQLSRFGDRVTDIFTKKNIDIERLLIRLLVDALDGTA